MPKRLQTTPTQSSTSATDADSTSSQHENCLEVPTPLHRRATASDCRTRTPLRTLQAGVKDEHRNDDDCPSPPLDRAVRDDGPLTEEAEGVLRSVCTMKCEPRRESNDSNDDSDDDSRQEAVEEAHLQVCFAEQTAKEMQQVMDWWEEQTSDGSQTARRSQSVCLKANSLIYASPMSSGDSWDDGTAAETDPGQPCPEQHVFQSPPDKDDMALHAIDSSRLESVELETFLSDTTASPWLQPRRSDSLHREAQSQAFAVDSVCSQVRLMSDILAELDDTSVDDDDMTQTPPRCTTLEDLPLVVQCRLVLCLWCRQLCLCIQQWLSHTLPPSMVSAWLALSSYRKLHYFILPATMFLLVSLMYTILPTTSRPPRLCLVCFDSSVYLDDESVPSSCDEFIQDVLL